MYVASVPSLELYKHPLPALVAYVSTALAAIKVRRNTSGCPRTSAATDPLRHCAGKSGRQTPRAPPRPDRSAARHAASRRPGGDRGRLGGWFIEKSELTVGRNPHAPGELKERYNTYHQIHSLDRGHAAKSWIFRCACATYATAQHTPAYSSPTSIGP